MYNEVFQSSFELSSIARRVQAIVKLYKSCVTEVYKSELNELEIELIFTELNS